MGTQVTLKAEVRQGTGKGVARKLRGSGKLPAVVYGADVDPIPVTLDAHDTAHLFNRISVDNTIVNLEVDGEKAPLPTLVREVQTHPFRPDILHVDFYRVQTGVAVELDIPVHLTGTPTGVKDEGGVLEQTIHDLPVRCIPAAIPESFEVDVSGLEIGDSIHVSDLTIPDEVEVLLDLSRTVCSVQIPSIAVVETEEEEEEDLEPELIGEEEAEGELEASEEEDSDEEE